MNKFDVYGFSDFVKSVEDGNLENIKRLFAKEYLTTMDDRGFTPLHIAAWYGNIVVVQLLMQYGADLEAAAQHDGRTPMHLAAGNNHADVVKLLIDTNPNMDSVDAADMDGWTPMHHAVFNGHEDLVKLLIERDANIECKDKKLRRPAHLACLRGHSSVLNCLMAARCLTDAKDAKERTLLDLTRKPSKLGNMTGLAECNQKLSSEAGEQYEFDIIHLPSYSIVNRKHRIYDFHHAVTWIKENISPINRPIVVGHFPNIMRCLPSSLRSFRLSSETFKYPEYIAMDVTEDIKPNVLKLRHWSVNLVYKKSDIHLIINIPVDMATWSQYVSVVLVVKKGTATAPGITILSNGTLKGKEIKEIFKDVLKLQCRANLTDAVCSAEIDKDRAILSFNKLLTANLQMLIFYQNDGEKMSNSSDVGSRTTETVIRVIQKDVKSLQLLPPLPRDQWTKDAVSKLMLKEYILIVCVTDDKPTWAISRDDCETVGDLKKKMNNYAQDVNMKPKPVLQTLQSMFKKVNDEKYLLIGSSFELKDETKLSEISGVIHYAILSPYGGVEKNEVIGGGSFGSVFKCKLQKDDRTFAMKQIQKPKKDDDPTKSIINEILVSARVGSHPNVIKFFRFYESNVEYFILMEFMEESLYQHLRKKKPLDEADIISFAQQILAGLKHLHDHKVIHRDLKSKNVLLDKNNCTKLCDFGLSICCDGNTSELLLDSGGDDEIGTARYMAPEVFTLESKVNRPKYGQKSDIWSFGATMVEIITGAVPYFGYTDGKASQLIQKKKRIKYEFPERYSAPLNDFVQLCLRPEPENRPTCAMLLVNRIFQR